MADTSRKLNFIINISRTDAKVIGQLKGELRRLSTDLGAVAAAMNAVNTASTNIGQVLQNIASAINSVKTAAIGKLAQELEKTRATTGRTSKQSQQLATTLNEVSAETSKASNSTKELKNEEELIARTIINYIRNSTTRLQKDKERLDSLRRQKVGIDEVVGSEANLDRKIIRLNERIVLNNSIVQNARKIFSNLSFDINKLGVNIENVNKNYDKVSEGLIKYSNYLARISQQSRRVAELQKLAAKEAAQAQKNASREIERAEKTAQAERIRAIKLTTQIAESEARRQVAIFKQTRVQQIQPIAGTEGARLQQEALKASKAAIDAYDKELKESNEVIKKHDGVQRASAEVTAKAANFQVLAAREVVAARNMITSSYSKKSIVEAKAAYESRKAAEEELRNSKRVLEQRRNELNSIIALRNQAASAAKISASQQRQAITSLNAEFKNQTTILDNLVNGFNRVIGTQLKYFAATLLIFGVLAKLREAFESILEVADRTAKVFAVSRSNILLLQERYELLGKTIEETSAATGKSIQDVSEILFQFGSAGLQAEESIAALNSTLNLIIATDAEVALTTKTIAATYRILGNTIDDVGDSTARFARINDVIAATYRDNQVEIGELNQAYKYSLPVAQQLGLTIEQLSGILGTLQNNMIRAGEAGRSLRVIFSRMSRESVLFSQAFGIAIDPNRPLDFLDIIEQVNKRLQSGALTTDQLSDIFERLGLRGANSFLILTQKTDELRESIRRLQEDSAGAADAMARVRLESAAGQVKIFKENVLLLIRNAIAPLAAILLKVIETINIFANTIRGTEVEKLLKVFVGLLGILGALKIAIVAVTIVKKILIKVTLAAAAASAKNALAMEKEAAAAGQLSLFMGAAAVKTGVQATQVGFLASAYAVLKGAAIAVYAALGPIGITIAAITVAVIAAAAAYAYFRKNLEDVLKANQKQLDSLNENIRERKKQLDSLDDTIKRLEEVSNAYEEGRATLADTTAAIHQAARAHHSLATAALLSKNNINEFIVAAIKQREIMAKIISDMEGRKIEIFADSVKAIEHELLKMRTQVVKAQNNIDDYRRIVTGAASAEFRLEKGISATDIAYRENLEIIEKNVLKAQELQTALDKLVGTNKEAAEANVDLVKSTQEIIDEFAASSKAATVFSNIIDDLAKVTRGVEKFEFSEKIDEVVRIAGNFSKGLEGLRDFTLFKLQVEIDENELKRAEDAIKYSIDAIEQYQAGKDLNLAGFLLDPKFIEEHIDTFTGGIRSQLEASLKTGGVELEIPLIIDQGLLLEASKNVKKIVEDNDVLLKDSKEREEIENNIDKLRKRLLDDLEKSITDSDKFSETQIYINELFKDKNNLYNLFVLSQERSSILSTQYSFLQDQINKKLNEAKTINLNVSNQIENQLELLGQQIKRQEDAKKEIEDALRLREEEAKQSLDLKVYNDKILEANQKLSVSYKSQSDELLKQINRRKLLRDEEDKGNAAIRAAKLALDDNIVSLTVERDLHNELVSSYKKRLIELADIKAKEEERILINAKLNEYKAKSLDFERKISKEIENVNLQLFKSQQNLDLILYGNSDILKIYQDMNNNINNIRRISLEIAKIISTHEQKEERINEISEELFKLYSKRKKDYKKINELVGVQNVLIKDNIASETVLRARRAQINSEYENSLKLLHSLIDVNSMMKQLLIDEYIKIDEINLKLLESNEIRNKSAINAIKEKKYINELRLIQERRVAVEKHLSYLKKDGIADQFLFNKYQKELISLDRERLNNVVNKIVDKQKELNELKKNESSIQESINNVNQTQLGFYREISSMVEQPLAAALQFEFDEDPLFSALKISRELGISLAQFERLGPQNVINKFIEGIKDGSIDINNFSGAIFDAAEAIRQMALEEQELLKVQNEIKRAQFDIAFRRFNVALGMGDLETAQKAYEDLSKSFEVFDPITGKIDYEATIENLNTIKDQGEILSDTYRRAGKDIESSLKDISKEREEAIINLEKSLKSLINLEKSLKSLQKTIQSEDFSSNFITQINNIIDRIKALDGLKIEMFYKGIGFQTVLDVTGYQEGGEIFGKPGIDKNLGFLTRGEYVINKDAVEYYGVETFEELNAKKFQKGGYVEKPIQVGNIGKPSRRIEQFGDFLGNLSNIEKSLNETNERMKDLDNTVKVYNKVVKKIGGFKIFGLRFGGGEETEYILEKTIKKIGDGGEEIIYEVNNNVKELNKAIDEYDVVTKKIGGFKIFGLRFGGGEEIIYNLKQNLNETKTILERQKVDIPVALDIEKSIKELDDVFKKIPKEKDVDIEAKERIYVKRNQPIFYQNGGEVFGKPGIDTIPAMLSYGEFVANKSAVKYYGVETFEALNAKKIPKEKITDIKEKSKFSLRPMEITKFFNRGGVVGFAEGGFVGNIQSFQKGGEVLELEAIDIQVNDTIDLYINPIITNDDLSKIQNYLNEKEYIINLVPKFSQQEINAIFNSISSVVLKITVTPELDIFILLEQLSNLKVPFVIDVIINIEKLQKELLDLQLAVRVYPRIDKERIAAEFFAITVPIKVTPQIDKDTFIFEVQELATQFNILRKDLFPLLNIPVNLDYEKEVSQLENSIAAVTAPKTIQIAFAISGEDESKYADIIQFTDIRKYQHGGSVDTVPAMLTPGEFVITKKIVNLLGIDFFNSLLNIDFAKKIKNILGFQKGGLVGKNNIKEDKDIFGFDLIYKFKKGGLVGYQTGGTVFDTGEGFGLVGIEFKTNVDELEGALRSIRNTIEGFVNNVYDKIKTIGEFLEKGPIKAMRSVLIAFDKFRKAVDNASKQTKELAKNLINAFGTPILKVIDKLEKTLTKLFSETMPNLVGFFVDDFLLAGAEIVSSSQEANKNISDSFLKSRSDLVEQLKRNEISYFDYFNKLEDLNKEKDDNMTDSTEKAVDELQNLLNNFVGEFSVKFSGFAQNLIDEFSGAFDEILGKMEEIAGKIFDTFDEIGGVVGGAIGGIFGGLESTGLSVGSAIGGAVGGALQAIVPIVTGIGKAFGNVVSSSIKGVLSIIPYIVKLGTMSEEEFQGMLGFIEELPVLISGGITKSGKKINGFIADFSSRLTQVVGLLLEKLPTIIDELIKAFRSVLEDISTNIGPVIKLISEQFIKFFLAAMEELPSFMNSVFVAIADAFATILNSPTLFTALKTTITSIIDIIIGAIDLLIIPLIETFADAVPDIITAIVNGFSENSDKLWDAASDLLGVIISVFSSEKFSTDIQNAIFGATGVITNVGIGGGAGAITQTAFERTEIAPDVIDKMQADSIFINTGIGGGSAEALKRFTTSGLERQEEALGLGEPIFGSVTEAFGSLLNVIGQLVTSISPLIQIFITLLSVLFPVFTAIADVLSGLLVPVLTIVTYVVKLLVKLIQPFVDGLQRISKSLASLEPLLELIGTVIFTILNPIFDLLAAFTGIALEVYIGPLVALINIIVNVFLPVLELLMPVFLVMSALLSSVIEVITRVTTAIQYWLERMKLLQIIIKYLGKLFEWLEGILWEHSLIPAFEALLNIFKLVSYFIENTLNKVFSQLSNTIQTLLEPTQNIIDLFKEMADFMSGNFKEAFEGITGAVGTITETVNEAAGESGISKIVETVKSVVGAIGSLIRGHEGGIFVTSNNIPQSVYDTMNMRPGEGIAILQTGEGILTREAVNILGSENLFALNRGENPFNATSLQFGAIDTTRFVPSEDVMSFRKTDEDIATTGDTIYNNYNEGDYYETKEINLEINIDLSNANFSSEDAADVIVNKITQNIENREGPLYQAINKVTGGKETTIGIRKRM